MALIDRRRFLALGIFVVAATATWQALKQLGVWLADEPPSVVKPDAFLQIVRRRLAYLRIADADVEEFAKDFRSRTDRKILVLQVTAPEDFEYELCAKLLMSTDFFFNGADVNRPVRYVVFYDPYNGCTSPFARVM